MKLQTETLRRALAGLSALLFLWAAIVMATGGIDWRVAGVSLRSRAPDRAVIAGIVLAVAWYAVDRRLFTRDVERASALASRAAPGLVAALSCLVVFHAIHNGSFIAAGSDAYGYVSQAYGWANGVLPKASATPLSLDVPNREWVQAPLGYTPGTAPQTIVPKYAPGLPFLMAIAIRLTGAIGPYLMVPACAGLFVWFTYLLGARTSGRAAGLAAALLAATSAILLFQAIWPMSDVPAAACFTGAAALSLRPSRASALASGALAAIGLLIRPNLLPLAVVPLIGIFAGGARRDAFVRACVFLFPIGCAALIVARLNTLWYGSPVKSGYGDTDALFSFGYIVPNLRRYGPWTWQSESPGILAALLALPAAWRRSPARAGIVMAWTMVAVTVLSYLTYVPFDAWWFIRFLLPGFGALFALAAAGFRLIARGVPSPWGRVAAIVALVLMARHGLVFARSENVFGVLRDTDHRYADLGQFIREALPPNAVFLAMQHSGPIRFYAGRMTIRYDYLDGESIHRVPRELERQGFHPYLAIDDWEVAWVERQFGMPAGDRLPWPMIAKMRKNGDVAVYDLAPDATGRAAVTIPTGVAPRYSLPQPLVLEPHPAR